MTTIKITYTFEVNSLPEETAEPEKMQGDAEMTTEVDYYPIDDGSLYQAVCSNVIEHFYTTMEKKGHINLYDLRVWAMIHEVEVLSD